MASAVPRYQSLPFRAHLRRNRHDEFAFQQAAEPPAVAEVLQQRLAAKLNDDVDRMDAGVDEAAQHEIDDPIFPAEGHRRLGSFLGERVEARPLAAREHEGQNFELHVRSPFSDSDRDCAGLPVL